MPYTDHPYGIIVDAIEQPVRVRQYMPRYSESSGPGAPRRARIE